MLWYNLLPFEYLMVIRLPKSRRVLWKAYIITIADTFYKNFRVSEREVE